MVDRSYGGGLGSGYKGSGSWGGGGGGGGPSPHQGMKSKKQLEREREQQIHSTRQNLFGSQSANLQQQAAAKAALARQEEDRRKQKAIEDLKKAEKIKEQKLAAEAAFARQEFDRLAAERREKEAREQKRLADEEQRRIDTAKRLEEQRLANEAEEQRLALEAMAARKQLEQEEKMKAYQKTFQPDVVSFAESLKTPGVKPYSFSDAAHISMSELTDSQRQALEDRGFDLANLAYTPGEGILGLEQQPMIRDINTGEIVGYPSEGLTGYLGAAANLLGVDTSGINFGTDPMAERGIGDRGQGNELGLSPEVYTQIQADAQAAAEAEADAQAEQEEVLTGFSPQYTTSPATSGIATVPATGNYMDYMQYAFRPVNLANPFGGSPTRNITGYNPLFANNPVYAANGGRIGLAGGGGAYESWKDFVEPLMIEFPELEGMSNEEQVEFLRSKGMIRDDAYNTGGRVGKMHGGIMVMGDEGVVNNGIGGILSKYKEIRSEL